MLRILQSRCNQNGLSLLKLTNTLPTASDKLSTFNFCVLRNLDNKYNIQRLKATSLETIFYKRNEFLASDDIDYAYKQLLELCLKNNDNNIDPTKLLIVDDVHSKYAFIFKKDMYCTINQ